ncbi:hypothetical protein B0H11DRAFT_1671626, partial [Mycena galericulata]
EFHPINHTLTQSSFLQPCKALAQTSTTGQVGFKSGLYRYFPAIRSIPLPSSHFFQTAPIWSYCGQQGPPMRRAWCVFSINAVESGPNNFAAL